MKAIDFVITLMMMALWAAVAYMALEGWKMVRDHPDAIGIAGAVIFTLIAITPIIMAYDYVKSSRAHQEEEIVTVEVTDIEYKKSETRYIYVNKIMVPTFTESRHEVTLEGGGHSEVWDSESMYNEFKVGDKFKVTRIDFIDGKGRKFKSEFRLN